MQDHENNPDVIRLSDPASLLGVLPAILGFHPTNSLCTAFIDSETGRIGPVARVDLPIPEHSIAQLVATGARFGDQVIVVAYSDDDADRPQVQAVAEALSDQMDVLAVIHTANAPAPLNASMYTATVLAGRSVLRDRQELERSVEHTEGTPPNVPYELATVIDRDRLISLALRAPHEHLHPLLSAVRSLSDDDPRCASACITLALVAYRLGDGALAQVALARTQRVDPGHRLADLTQHLFAIGITPTALGELAESIVIPVPHPAQQDEQVGR